MEETYNGWPNRETWALNLWLGNDEGLYMATEEVADAAYDASLAWHSSRDIPFIFGNADIAVGETIMEWAQDELPEIMGSARYADLVRDVGSFWRIDVMALGAAWTESKAEVN